MEKFARREGHARVPGRYREDGYRLGQWAIVQRHAYQKGSLDPARRARLEALPGWEWDLAAATWDEAFAHLHRFVKREGHARVPQKWREGDFELGSWVLAQRQKYGKGVLDGERVARFEALPGWTWHPHEARWEDGFAHLQYFVKREGNARVPPRWRENGYRLDAWVDQQRQLFRKGKLDPQRRTRLDSVPGWTWWPRRDVA